VKGIIRFSFVALFSISTVAALKAVAPDPQSPPAAPTSVTVGMMPPTSSSPGLWIGRTQLLARPMSGTAWTNLKSVADRGCSTPNLSNQDDPANVCVMAQALVYARTGTTSYRTSVITALRSIVNSGTYSGRALALGRELAAYIIAADVIDLKTADPTLDNSFRAKLRELRTTPTTDGPDNLVVCHEMRPNNWGTNCGATRAAIDVYIGDTTDLARTAKVFKGWLGDRASYAGFTYGDLSWQCNSSAPVGINPTGCSKDGHSLDGVLPDDQRRGGSFTWPAPQEPYTWGALQGVLPLAVILHRAGYDVFNWQDRAMLRSFQWLHSVNNFPAEGDDTWLPHLVNHFYSTSFPAPIPSQPGKNIGWAEWTHGR